MKLKDIAFVTIMTSLTIGIFHLKHLETVAYSKDYRNFAQLEQEFQSKFKSEIKIVEEEENIHSSGEEKLIENKCGLVEKVGWGLENSWIMQQAYEISNCDKDFVLMLEAENGMWSFQRRHNPANNTVGVDWGLCGINDYYHPQIVNDPKFLTDQVWQLEECHKLWVGGTTFYGARGIRKEKARKNIIFH